MKCLPASLVALCALQATIWTATAASQSFDFGPASGAVIEPGYTLVTPSDPGWIAGSILAVDRGAGAPSPAALKRDQCYATDMTFEVTVPNGTYNVAITAGDFGFTTVATSIYLEGILVASAPAQAASNYYTNTLSTTVSDGKLTLRMIGSSGNAKLNALVITSTGGTTTGGTTTGGTTTTTTGGTTTGGTTTGTTTTTTTGGTTTGGTTTGGTTTGGTTAGSSTTGGSTTAGTTTGGGTTGAPPTTTTKVVLYPGDPGYRDALISGTGTVIGYGAFVDLPTTDSSGNPVTYASGYSPPVGAPQPIFNGPPDALSGFGTASSPGVYDSWSSAYQSQDSDGLDNNGNGIVDEPSEKSIAPPYSAPLQAVQVRVRVYDPGSGRVREVIVTQSLKK